MKTRCLSGQKRAGLRFKTTGNLLLILAVTLFVSGCVSNVKNLGRKTKYLDKKSVAERIESHDSLYGNTLQVRLQAMGDRPYEVTETREEKYTCGFTYGVFHGIKDPPTFLMAFCLSPLTLVLDAATLCQGAPSKKRTTVVEQDITTNALLPDDLIGEVIGHLKISETSTGKIFTDRVTQYRAKHGVFEIELPVLNNGGHLRVEFEGDVSVGSQRFSLSIDRQVAI